MYGMTAVDERCGVLGGNYSSWALLLSMGGGASGVVRVFCAPRICGRNQVDQNSAYGISKRVLNPIQFYWGYSELYLRVVLENPGTGCLICRCYVSEVLTLRVSRSCVDSDRTVSSRYLVCICSH